MSCSTLVYNASVWKWKDNVVCDLSNDILGEAVSGYCIVIKNGFITYVGLSVPSEEFDIRIDAKNSLVLPGLIDSHIHVGHFAESQYFVDLSECYSIQQLVEKVKFHIEKYPDLPWITGVNWDQTKLGRFPTRHDLGFIETTKPVFLYRACWHIGVANDAALKCAHILEAEVGKTAQSPAGGVIEEDEDGVLTGILKERAVELIYIAQQNLSKVKNTMNNSTSSALEQKMRFIKEGVDICARLGLTTVQTNDEGALSAYRSLQGQDKLPLRVFLTPIHDELKRSADTENGIQGISTFRPECMQVDSIPGSNNNNNPAEATNGWDRNSRLLMERVKIFSDGSLGADTAALRVYSADSKDTTSNMNESKGVFVYERTILAEMLVETYEQGYRVEVHAIGDAAAERVLSALDDCEKLLQQRSIHPIKVCDHNESLKELRHWRPILTHCQVLGADLVERMASKGIVANVQPSFVPTDMQWVRDRLTGPQLEYSYVWKTLLQYSSMKKTSEEHQSILSIAGGSDAPIETPNPFTGMYDAIMRSNKQRIKLTLEISTEKTAVANEVNVFKPEECLTFSQALWAYTIGGAYAAGVENRLGQIAPGFLGDLVLIDPAVLVDSDKLFALVPDMVLVGGLVSAVNATSRSGDIPVLEKCIQPLSYLQPEETILPPSDALSDAVYHPGRGGYPSTTAVVDILNEKEEGIYCVPIQKHRKNLHASSGFSLPMGLKCACILTGKFCSVI